MEINETAHMLLLFSSLFAFISSFPAPSKLLKPTPLPNGLYIANLHAKIAGRNERPDGGAARRSESRDEDPEFVPVGTGLVFLPHGRKQKIAVRYRTWNRPACLTLQPFRLPSESAVAAPRPILSLFRRFYAPLMEPKLRTIGRSMTLLADWQFQKPILGCLWSDPGFLLLALRLLWLLRSRKKRDRCSLALYFSGPSFSVLSSYTDSSENSITSTQDRGLIDRRIQKIC